MKLTILIEDERIKEKSISQIKIINTIDPFRLDQYLSSKKGQEAILNVIVTDQRPLPTNRLLR